MITIGDPKIVQELYTTNNKHFDKHPIVRDVTMRLLGNSILFADTNPEWKKRRVAFAPAFYKGKLIKLFDIAKECVRTTVKRWRTIEGGKPRTRFDFMEEMQMMSGRILLSCALGEDITEKLIPYRRGGKVEMRQINWVLLQTFGDCLHRMASPHTLMFPFLRYWYILPSERDNLANCLEIRKAI